MQTKSRKQDKVAVSWEVSDEVHEMLLVEALKQDTTLDAVVERAVEIGFLREKPYPKATPEERLKMQAKLATFSD